jgi:hypothetical protein
MSAKDTANRRWTLIGFVFSTVNPRRLRSANNPIAKIGFVFHLSITLLTTGFEAQTALAFAIEFVFSTVNPGVGSKRKTQLAEIGFVFHLRYPASPLASKRKRRWHSQSGLFFQL